MGIRAIIVLLALSGLGIYWGGTNFYTALRERDPLEITCADYLKNHPENRYLRLTQCEPDLDNTAIEEEGDSKAIKAVYIPLRAKGTAAGQTEIVLKRTDKDMTSLMGSLESAGPDDEAKGAKVLAELEGPNEGLVQFGMDLDDKDMRELKGLHLGLANDFIIMEHGKSPKLLLGALALAAGLAGLAFMVRGVIRRFRPAVA